MSELAAMRDQIVTMREQADFAPSEAAAMVLDEEIEEIIQKFIAAGGDVRDFGDDPFDH